MEYLGELIALGIDTVICGICLRQYLYCKNAITAVSNAERLDSANSISALVNKNPNNNIGYVAVRGIVKPIGEPLQSMNHRGVTGVIQKLSIKEHVVARTTAGFWSDQENTMQNIYYSIPFVLQQGRYKIEVVDPLSADILDLDVVSDHFEPSVPTFIDHLWGFFTGVRQRGLQTTEEMLREGTTLTGIGELSQSNKDTLLLQPPLNGAPFYLTSMSVNTLLQKLEDRRKVYRWLFIMFGTVGLVIGGIVARRYWKDKAEQRLSEELRQSLAASRKERRQRVRDKDLRDDQLCVVCRTNPREIILLPCGHVCLCEDCSDDITNDCPVCRSPVIQKAAAYIA